MTERKVPGLTFEQIKAKATPPREVSPERWETGMAVTEYLMKEGTPVNVVKDSINGPDFPNKFYVTGTGVTVTVEHMPHWSYATVDNGEKRTNVFFTEAVQSEENGIASRDLPKEKVLAALKKTIVKSWK